MTTDPHIYKGEYCDLHIRPSDAPESVEVEVFSQKRKNGLWIEVPVAKVRSMLAASVLPGSYTRTDEEGWQARAEKAEKERDGARGALRAQIKASAQPRPLTADDITDKMVERAARQYVEEDYTSWERSPALTKNNARESVRGILEAALTEPPPRPEGAAELHQVLDAIYQDEPGITHRGNFADMLATYGVRVASVGLTPTNPEEQP